MPENNRMHESETALHLTQWHRGRREALEALLKRNLPWIHERVHQRLGPKLHKMVDTVDIVQDSMLQVLRYAPRFTISDEAQFRGLIAKIVENVLRDKNDWYTAKRRDICKQKPLPSDTVLDLQPRVRSDKTPSQSAQRHEEEAWIRLGLELLSPIDREILILRQWDSLSFDEICKRLDVTKPTAYKRYRRALSRLAKVVGKLRRGHVETLLEEETP